MARADMPGDWSDIPAPMTPQDMKQPIPPPLRPGTRQVGVRLECAACEEVEMWCQCEPSPWRPDPR